MGFNDVCMFYYYRRDHWFDRAVVRYRFISPMSYVYLRATIPIAVEIGRI